MNPTFDLPRICTIDLQLETNQVLVNHGFNIRPSTFGDLVKLPITKKGESHNLLLNFDFPENLHEYDVVIADLGNYRTREYNSFEHTRDGNSAKTEIAIHCSYPQTVFDPRPVATSLLRGELEKISGRKYLTIIFATRTYEIPYEPLEISSSGSNTLAIETHSIYSFSESIPLGSTMTGDQIVICEQVGIFSAILGKHSQAMKYEQTFNHPTSWTNGVEEKNDNFIPLLTNRNGDIISYIEFKESEIVLMLPQFEDKTEFLAELLTTITPVLFPEIFPDSATFSWTKEHHYWLPNHAKLLTERSAIEEEYYTKIEENDSKILINQQQHNFLHALLTETGEPLVHALKEFFVWIGFENVIIADEQSTSILEEDLRIEFDQGMLLIECKGISGTSTDSDCSQIYKIKNRRIKQRAKFDVWALYIVNHQRFAAPLLRRNPPFTEHQISDAENDERGLLSTWQLFTLYSQIENNIISKFEARNQLLQFGLVSFQPENLIYIDQPTEILKNGTVSIVNLKDVLIQVNDEVMAEKNGKYVKLTVLGLQKDDQSLTSATSGELGLLLSGKINMKTKLWKITTPNVSS